MPRPLWPNNDDFYPDDHASADYDETHYYPMQFEQLLDIVKRREKWLLTLFGEQTDIWLRILPSDPNFIPCSCRSNERGQSIQNCLMCYGTGALGGYQKLTVDKLASIRLDQSRNHISPIDHDGQRLVSNREVDAWDESRLLSSWDRETGQWLVRFPMQARNQELMEHGLRQRESVGNCWFFSPIKLDDRDFFVRANGRRYKFKDINDSSWRGIITHTQFTAEVVDYEDIIYQVGIKGSTVGGFQESEDIQVQEQLAEEQPIFAIDPLLGQNFLESFDFGKLFSNQRNRRRAGRR